MSPSQELVFGLPGKTNATLATRVIILAGGGGTRLWPLSTTQRAKQFLPLDPQRPELPLLVSTLARLRDFLPSPTSSEYASSLWFVAGSAMAEPLNGCLMDYQMEAFSPNLILEPEARNTGPAIALATAFIAEKASQELSQSHEDEVLVFLPADHAVADDDAFCRALNLACEYAKECQAIVTLGIIPTHPETGYGYIELEEVLTPSSSPEAKQAKRFVEKPSLEAAERYLASGRYLWNAGVFVATVSALKAAFLNYAPSLGEAFNTSKPYSTLLSQFSNMPAISFDYAVMEKLQPLIVVPVSCGWSDLGSWDSLAEAAQKIHSTSEYPEYGEHKAQNLVMGTSQISPVVFNHSSGVTVWQDDTAQSHNRPVAVIGMEDCLIVDSPKGLLIMKRGASQHVKDVLTQLSSSTQSSSVMSTELVTHSGRP
jgi:mannose-1-phosphate guanylyltransferase/mannose-6-phosphate isomerase